MRVPVVVRSLSRAEGENVGGRGRAKGEKLRQTMKASVSSCQVGAGEKKKKRKKRGKTYRHYLDGYFSVF